MKKASKKKITMDVLAGMISAGTKETKTFVRKEIADLAGMVQRGFLDVSGKLNTVEVDIKSVKKDVAELKNDVKELREDFHKILTSLDKVTKQYADYLEERKLRDVEIERLKRWVEQIAQKVGVKLLD
ncbi:hypothetical protein KJ590_01570 [Patescibacteria group bacterium]|nr:hypothetical protein [Patescibacteria group bacterium]MBU4142670.1 hypothetical protein [Patescibacteria group bacterium]